MTSIRVKIFCSLVSQAWVREYTHIRKLIVGSDTVTEGKLEIPIRGLAGPYRE